MTTLDNEKLAKTCTEYYCEPCDYYNVRKSSYLTHLATRKHQKTTQNNEKLAKTCKKIYNCECCEKVFNDRAGLWRHKKKCNEDSNYHGKQEQSLVPSALESSPELITLITELVKSNNGLQQSIIEICKNGSMNNSNNITNINSNNKSFNLQIFLNETCKDAMNIMEFVESIQLQLSDLEKVGEIGYIEGISNIIVKNLNALDVTKRPIHCTDKKREVLYVKDENKWEKEDKENNKVRKVIKRISRKNSSLLKNFREKYPDYGKSESKVSDQYNKLIIEAMGGKGDNDTEKENKIIKNIAKVVSIEKIPEP
jgi:hypothetical protein